MVNSEFEAGTDFLTAAECGKNRTHGLWQERLLSGPRPIIPLLHDIATAICASGFKKLVLFLTAMAAIRICWNMISRDFAN